MLVFDGEYSADHAPGKIWHFSQKITKKTAMKDFVGKTFFTKFFYLFLWACLQPLLQDCLRKYVFISTWA